jgi:hypothetical protein
MKKLIVLASLLFASSLFAGQLVTVKAQNTSQVSDEQALKALAHVIANDPSYLGKTVSLTVGEESKEFEVTRIVTVQSAADNRLKMKKPETEMGADQWARNVGAIIRGATSGLEGSATVSVNVTHKENKPDGTTSETGVKVEVTVSAKK